MGRTYAYGATGQKPGTLIKVTTPDKPATGSPFGSTCHVAAYPKGPIGQLAGPLKSGEAERIFGLSDRGGGFAGDIQGCLAAQHLFDVSNGAATLYALRVTDGNELAAALALYDRDVDTSYAVSRAAAKLAGLVGTISASNGGRWAGQSLVCGGKVGSVSSAISGSDFDTGLTGASWPFTADELKGISFALEGESRTWVVESNDAAGVITVVGDFVGVTTTDGRWRVRGENIDANGAARGLGLMVRDGTQDPDDAFHVLAIENRKELRADLDNLVVDPTKSGYFETLIKESLDASQYEITAEDSGLCTAVDRNEKKPANFAEIAVPAGVTARTVKFRIMNFQITGAGNGYAGALVNGGAMVPHKYVLTVKAGATACTVAAYDITGTKLLASGLTDLTIGSAYAAPHSFLSGFTLTNGGTVFVAADVIEIYVRPLPVSAGGTGLLPKLSGWFYPHAFGATGTGGKDVTTRYRVYSNTYDTITLGPNDDVSAVVVTPGLPTLTGVTAWDTTKDTTGKTFIFQLQGAGAVTLTMTGASTQTCAAAASELSLIAGATDKVTFEAITVGGHTYLKATTADAKYGPAYNLKVTTGTLNALAGYTDNTTVVGATPTVGRLEFYQDLEGGRDGVADLSAADFTAIWDAEDSPVLALRTADVGAVELAMPGVTDAAAQQAMVNFAPIIGFMARVEIPSTVLVATAMRKWLRDNITPNDFFRVAFPSYGYLASNPTGARTKYLSTLTGALQGLRARYARDYSGYHKAAADTAALLSPLFSSLATDRLNGQAVELDEDLINGFGAEIIRHVGPSIYRFGARIPGENWQWGWGHKIECLLHIKQELLAVGDPLTFQIIDGPEGKKTQLAAYGLARKILEPHFNAGWFSGVGSFESDVSIICDSGNNTKATADAGRLLCNISADIVNTAEKVEFGIGQKAVTTGGGNK